jgi:glycosyltransferase involved in cell wall biosynthesis
VFSGLVVHNYYQQPGGEDQVFANESALLAERGHRLIRYSDHNNRIEAGNIATAGGAVWNQHSYRALRELVRNHRPDVAHFHNTFPLISPAGYYAVRSQGVPVVQTLHNYRLICPGATLFRGGGPCEDCIDRRSFTPALVHGCYRDNRAATAGVATMLTIHRAQGTWQRAIDVYIALSEFARRKFIEGGLPADRIVVKPNFLARDPAPSRHASDGSRGYALFAGRISEEKGVRTLAQAWARVGEIPLVVAGDGPLKLEWPAGVKVLGKVSPNDVLELMRGARVLVFPSSCYECAPMTIIEAFACGLPVIASNLGSVPEFVTHGRNGLLFTVNDADDLAQQVRWAFDHPAQLLSMGAAARREYEEKYTSDRNYRLLMDVYRLAMEGARRRAAS